VPRDHRKLGVFAAADGLVLESYAFSRRFPASERFGLQAQLRRAAVSVASNIVEGSSRRTTREYLRFLNVAAGSAAEAAYLVELSTRLGFLDPGEGERWSNEFNRVAAQLHAIIRTLETSEGKR
jgi:four helix bundle protein